LIRKVKQPLKTFREVINFPAYFDELPIIKMLKTVMYYTHNGYVKTTLFLYQNCNIVLYQ